MSSQFSIAELVQTACIWEATARKVGNIHPGADFSGTTYLDFILSAAAIAPRLANAASGGIGPAVLASVQATTNMVGQNTNLGMVLLLAPLCAVEEAEVLQAGVARVLAGLSVDDAKQVFAAIRLASPGGLGQAPEQDVREEPTVTLLEAMKLAADRDQIARQYASGFADIFEFCLPTWLAAFHRFGNVEAAIIDLQIHLLAAFPDSLIARKNGPTVAREVLHKSSEILALGGLATAEGREAGARLDRYLREQGNRLNPGTTADLIAACLFAALRENKVIPSAPFRWQVEDWL